MSLINPANVKDFPINYLLSLGDNERTQCHCGKMELGSYMFKLHDPWLGFSSAAPMKTLGLSPIDYFTQELNHHLKRKNQLLLTLNLQRLSCVHVEAKLLFCKDVQQCLFWEKCSY